MAIKPAIPELSSNILSISLISLKAHLQSLEKNFIYQDLLSLRTFLKVHVSDSLESAI